MKDLENKILYPNIGLRAGSVFLDGLICGVINLLLSIPIIYVFQYPPLFLLWMPWITVWLYFAFMESSRKQATVGKMLQGITVVHQDSGQRISFLRASLRYLASILSSFFFIGYLMMLMTKRKQTLHDIIAKTLLIQKNPPPQVSFFQGCSILFPLLTVFVVSFYLYATLLNSLKPPSKDIYDFAEKVVVPLLFAKNEPTDFSNFKEVVNESLLRVCQNNVDQLAESRIKNNTKMSFSMREIRFYGKQKSFGYLEYIIQGDFFYSADMPESNGNIVHIENNEVIYILIGISHNNRNLKTSNGLRLEYCEELKDEKALEIWNDCQPLEKIEHPVMK